jgi:hypothetical protein
MILVQICYMISLLKEFVSYLNSYCNDKSCPKNSSLEKENSNQLISCLVPSLGS